MKISNKIQTAKRENERRVLTWIKQCNRQGAGFKHMGRSLRVAEFHALERLETKGLVIYRNSDKDRIRGFWSTAILWSMNDKVTSF